MIVMENLYLYGPHDDGQQSEDRGECQRHAVRGNRGKMIRRTKNGLDEHDPHNADNEPREVHYPHDSCGRSVWIHCSLVVIVYPFWLFRDWFHRALPAGERCG